MSIPNALQYIAFLVVVILLVKPCGGYLARVFEGEHTFLDPVMRPVERLLLRLMGIRPSSEMSWRTYATCFIVFSLVGTLALYGLLRVQSLLPGGPESAYLTTPMTSDLAMNTAASFSTTTTWQAYAGESTMRYWTQIAGLALQNFLAGGSGLAVGIAFIRGFSRRESETLGNFWVDLVRAILYVLLPLCLIGSLVLVWQGVPMNFSPYTNAATLDSGPQIIAQGPVAALEFIKNLGTNGGGFFNANGAHPYENPTPFTNFIEMLAIAVLPASLTFTFGRMIGRPRAGWTLFWVMAVLFTVGLIICDRPERNGNAHLAPLGLTGSNLEGKETRFGVGASVLTAVVTSNGATGSTNAAPDSFMPLGVSVPLANMLLGEIIFGGLGTGLYSLVMVALVGIFMAGLMVGRTPEYVGKKIGPREMKLVMLFNLATPLVVLGLTALAVMTGAGLAGLTTNDGPRGFTEILFAYASCMANNGQVMGGLSANTPFYNVSTAVAMMAGRFALAIPALALAGLLARQGRRQVTPGTMPSDSFLFATVVVGSALVIGGLNFLPALVLGPVVESLR